MLDEVWHGAQRQESQRAQICFREKDLELRQSLTMTEFYAARARFSNDVVAKFPHTGAYKPSLTARAHKFLKSAKTSADAKDIEYEEKEEQVLQIRADARTFF